MEPQSPEVVRPLHLDTHAQKRAAGNTAQPAQDASKLCVGASCRSCGGNTVIHFGRPFSVLSETQVAALIKEYDAKPFNLAKRTREMGLKRGTLGYHIRGGKAASAVSDAGWRSSLKKAYRSIRSGNKSEAAKWLRETAKRIEDQIK